MMARVRKSMEEKDQGFTLIELLVVMIIIGILAAIAVPVFLSQRAKARETAAKSDVSVIGKEISAFYVDGTGGLTVGTTAASGTTPKKWTLASSGTAVTSGNLSANNTASGTVTSATAWCVQVVTGESGDATWKYTQDGLAKGTC